VAPEFLHAAAHPVRWRLLSELARGDRQVHELTALLGQRQSLISYHLGRLRKAELVRTRRSTADGRDTYYLLDLARCAGLLAAAGGALHPALRLTRPPALLPAGARVLFLCTGNSARSQMAEALLRLRSGGGIEAFSAGSRPKPLHAYAVEAMTSYGVDLSAHRPKHLEEFTARRFDLVVTLCDRVREACPEFPGAAGTHWSIPDPSADPAGRAAFDRVAAELDERIGFLMYTLPPLAGGRTERHET
jgi:protein-tyrosine-phosphatase/DNA-binding transcriptional ArsR family regulator